MNQLQAKVCQHKSRFKILLIATCHHSSNNYAKITSHKTPVHLNIINLNFIAQNISQLKMLGIVKKKTAFYSDSWRRLFCSLHSLL